MGFFCLRYRLFKNKKHSSHLDKISPFELRFVIIDNTLDHPLINGSCISNQQGQSTVSPFYFNPA